MWYASPAVGTCHDTAKLFPRPGAAIEFQRRRQLCRSREWSGHNGGRSPQAGWIAHPVLFGFADSRIDTQCPLISGIFAILTLCLPLHSGSVFSSIFCTTAILVSLSTSAG